MIKKLPKKRVSMYREGHVPDRIILRRKLNEVIDEVNILIRKGKKKNGD